MSGIITSRFGNSELRLDLTAIPTYRESTNPSILFSDGIPSDGIPIEKIVTVSLALTVVYVIFATAGLAFAVACLLFTVHFRQKK